MSIPCSGVTFTTPPALPLSLPPQTNTQLRADLEQSQAANEEAKKLQAQQSAEIEKLKEALARETANVETERNAKWEASKERLTEWISMEGRELVG